MDSTIIITNPVPSNLNEEEKCSFNLFLFWFFNFYRTKPYYGKYWNNSNERKRSFQSPNCAARIPASGAPIIDPMAFTPWEKLRKLGALLEGTTSTMRGLAETWTIVFPIPNSANPTSTIENEYKKKGTSNPNAVLPSRHKHILLAQTGLQNAYRYRKQQKPEKSSWRD